MIRQDLSQKERVDTVPIEIVFEPLYEENIPVVCFFNSQIHLTYKSFVGCFEKGKEHVWNRVVKQCYYCENFFTKSNEAMKKHLSICAAREGITYVFDNGQIITFQEHFKYLGDVPFTVYFDFERTKTGQLCFFLPPKCM